MISYSCTYETIFIIIVLKIKHNLYNISLKQPPSQTKILGVHLGKTDPNTGALKLYSRVAPNLENTIHTTVIWGINFKT
jgi:hypothetical protein